MIEISSLVFYILLTPVIAAVGLLLGYAIGAYLDAGEKDHE